MGVCSTALCLSVCLSPHMRSKNVAMTEKSPPVRQGPCIFPSSYICTQWCIHDPVCDVVIDWPSQSVSLHIRCISKSE